MDAAAAAIRSAANDARNLVRCEQIAILRPDLPRRYQVHARNGQTVFKELCARREGSRLRGAEIP